MVNRIVSFIFLSDHSLCFKAPVPPCTPSPAAHTGALPPGFQSRPCKDPWKIWTAEVVPGGSSLRSAAPGVPEIEKGKVNGVVGWHREGWVPWEILREIPSIQNPCPCSWSNGVMGFQCLFWGDGFASLLLCSTLCQTKSSPLTDFQCLYMHVCGCVYLFVHSSFIQSLFFLVILANTLSILFIFSKRNSNIIYPCIVFVVSITLFLIFIGV